MEKEGIKPEWEETEDKGLLVVRGALNSFLTSLILKVAGSRVASS